MEKTIKTPADLVKIRQAAAIWKKVKNDLLPIIQPGARLVDLDQFARERIIFYGGYPTFDGKYGFPKNICISVNECVIHGVPTEYALKDGDKVSFDMGVTYDDHVCDACFTVVLGHNPAAEKISKVCRNAIREAQRILKPGVTNKQVAQVIQNYVESNGYKLLHDFSGHGCGNALHEEPMFPNYWDGYQFDEAVVEEKMVICIEPMIMTKSNAYFLNPFNGWDVLAKNGLLTCHWEDMFLITRDGCENLTSEEQ